MTTTMTRGGGGEEPEGVVPAGVVPAGAVAGPPPPAAVPVERPGADCLRGVVPVPVPALGRRVLGEGLRLDFAAAARARSNAPTVVEGGNDVSTWATVVSVGL